MRKKLSLLLLLLLIPTLVYAWGIMIVGGGVPTGVSPTNEDTFETGSFLAWWTSTTGAVVDTWASHGISGPSGGGSYGAEAEQNEVLKKDITDQDEIWIEAEIYSGNFIASQTAYFISVDSGDNGFVYIRFSQEGADEVIRAYSVPASTGWNSTTTTLTENTWYDVRYYVKIHASAGIVKVWIWGGSSWDLEINISGVNTGNVDIDEIWITTSGTSDTRYLDDVRYWESDPGW